MESMLWRENTGFKEQCMAVPLEKVQGIVIRCLESIE